MEFRKAERRKAKLRLAITGPAGSGKTYGALLVAKGLGGKIVLIDTENGSGDLYAIPFNYDVGTITAPYAPQKYLQAIHEAERANYDIIIIDSLSHVWAGEGGLLDMQGKIADSSKSSNSYYAWRQVTPWHNKLVDMILNSKCHVIATMRSKTEYIVVENEKGKQEPKKVGLAPVQRDGMEYEFTTVFDLSQNHSVSVSKDRTGIFDGTTFELSEETGIILKEWLNTGVDMEARKKLQQELWQRYLAVYENDTKQAKEAMRLITGKNNFDSCSDSDFQTLIHDIELKEKIFTN